jgi:transposase
MSLRSSPDSAIPEDTLRVAHTAFPKGNVFMRMRDAFGPIYRDPQFAWLFCQYRTTSGSPSPVGAGADDAIC